MDDLERRARRAPRQDQLVPEHTRQGLLLVFAVLFITSLGVGILLELS